MWWGASRQSAPAKGEAVKIGVVASLTGPGSFYGENIRKGTELATHEINESGGVGGRPLRIIFEDDATNPKQTVSAARKLIDIDDVLAIVGVQWDFLANAVAPVAAEKEVATISTAAPFDSLLKENQNPYMFTTFPSATGAISATKHFLQREEAQTAIILVTNNDWGGAYGRAYQQAADELGVAVVDTIRLPEVDSNDLKTPLARVRQESPDVLLTSINNADNINFVSRYRELGLEATVIMHENFADGVYTGRINRESAEGVYFFEYEDPTQDFVERYTSFHGEEPQIAADTAYDAIYVLAKALESGGVSREGTLQGLKQTRNYNGASGVIDFTNSNFPEDKTAFLRQVTASGVIDVE